MVSILLEAEFNTSPLVVARKSYITRGLLNFQGFLKGYN